jgi:hypothetical protein
MFDLIFSSDLISDFFLFDLCQPPDFWPKIKIEKEELKGEGPVIQEGDTVTISYKLYCKDEKLKMWKRIEMTPSFDFQVGAHDVIKGMEAMVRQNKTRQDKGRQRRDTTTQHSTIHGTLTLTHTLTLTLTLTKNT